MQSFIITASVQAVFNFGLCSSLLWSVYFIFLSGVADHAESNHCLNQCGCIPDQRGLFATAHAEQTEDVKVGRLILHIPVTWKKESPSSRMRLLQFRIPARGADREDAELAVFSFPGGGSVKQNIERWIGQFAPANREVSLFQGKTKKDNMC